MAPNLPTRFVTAASAVMLAAHALPDGEKHLHKPHAPEPHYPALQPAHINAVGGGSPRTVIRGALNSGPLNALALNGCLKRVDRTARNAWDRVRASAGQRIFVKAGNDTVSVRVSDPTA